MPFLTKGQAEDVAFAERRLLKPDGYGVLYTNGTGTGKTFSGLGIAARSAASGKDRILIIAPKQPIVDAWVKAGKSFFGLDINPLKNIQDNGGSGMVVTTFANLGANNSLGNREWDMVIADEAQYLSSSEDGRSTSALENLRAITRRRGYGRALVRMQNADLVEEARNLSQQAKEARIEEKNALAERLQTQANAINHRLDEMGKAMESAIAAQDPASKPRSVFLSATPFAYEKNVTWAQEFLFDWGHDDGVSSLAYNSGGNYERFMMQHFGYRMRYNKLTAPDAKVDSGIMQRAFNSWLRTEGALSARALESDYDYDRLFVTVESPIGRRVDAALKWLRDMTRSKDDAGNELHESDTERDAYRAVHDKITKDSFNYHSRMYFLEAIKAREAIPHIRAQLKAGRKVLAMHDFKKGGAVNPFRLSFTEDAEKAAYANFRGEFPDLIRAFDVLPSPIDQLTREFPDALVYNGSYSAKQRIQMQNQFNDDSAGSPRMIIAQGDAMREGVSIHDTTGKFPRVLVHLGMPVKPTASIQQEGRIYRTGQASNALFRYFTIDTAWERSAFAEKIAKRAGAAENLAMGEQARGLKQAFISAYESADLYEPGFDGEGVGGKESDRNAAAALTPWDTAKSFYFGTKQQGKGRAARGREGDDYFATPEPAGLKMVEWADIRGGESVLEPSAGHGAIARWFPDAAKVRVIEQSGQLASRVALHVDGDVVHGSFEDHNIVNKYDAIVMNPPYGLGGAVAIPHIAKAADHLRDGGRLVALIPTGPAADKKFDNWFYGQDKNGKSLHPDLHLVGDVKMPSVTFERAGTGVATRIVIIDKVGSDQASQMMPAKTIDLTSSGDIGELFDRMENLEMPARLKPVEEFEAEQTAPTKSVQDKGPKQTFAQKAAAGKPKLVSDELIFDYTAKSSGKVMRGAIVRGISLEEVKEKYYKYAFKMDGGVFLREEFIERPESSAASTEGRYRLADTGTKGIPLFSARAIANKISKATGLQVETVANEAGLPAAVQAQIKRDGVSGRVAGVYHNGTSYLIASNLRDTKHAISTVLHEAIGHGGVKAVLGNRINPVMRGIYRDMPAAMKRELERRYAGQTANLSAADAQVLIAEEYVAHLAETDPQNGVVDRLVAMLRQFIRSTFGDTAALKWTRNDLVQLLAEARQAASNGGEATRYRESAGAEALAALPEVSEASEAEFVESLSDEQASTFARAVYKARGTDSPYFQRWFG
ncbi:DEAD/DEAH box helicase family protein, partial [Pseudomonas sp.]|uniref:DEAD/DEAH box helicase family protein n=1 Tax=Pseudomonas sp. TaxID=306 RepID=UPI0040548958